MAPGPAHPYFPAIPGDSTFVPADAGETYPLQPQATAAIQLLASGGTSNVVDYIDIRQSDLADTGATSAAEPGSTVNWADFLFAGAGGWSLATPTVGVEPYIATPAGQQLILDSGVTPVYANVGSFT